LDEVVGVDVGVDGGELVLVQLVGAQVRVDLRLREDVGGELRADPVDVLEREEDLLPVGDVDTGDTRHVWLPRCLLVSGLRDGRRGVAATTRSGGPAPPCTGLCWGAAVQITRTFPLRPALWHEPQILRALALTFTAQPRPAPDRPGTR